LKKTFKECGLCNINQAFDLINLISGGQFNLISSGQLNLISSGQF